MNRKKLIVALSKSDLINKSKISEKLRKDMQFISISTVTGEGIESLKSKIVDIALNK